MDWFSWPLFGSVSVGSLTFCAGLFKSYRLAIILSVLSSAGSWLALQPPELKKFIPKTFATRLTGELQAIARPK